MDNTETCMGISFYYMSTQSLEKISSEDTLIILNPVVRVVEIQHDKFNVVNKFVVVEDAESVSLNGKSMNNFSVKSDIRSVCRK